MHQGAKKICLAALIFLCGVYVGLLVSRTTRGPAAADVGTLIASQELQSAETAVAHTTAAKPTTTHYPETEPVYVYWVPGGKVYHATDQCYHIAGRKDIHKTTIAEAEAKGKTRYCEDCGGGK